MLARPALPAAGKFDLQLLCMPDSWVGCDKSVPIRLKVRGRVYAALRHLACPL